MAENVGKPLGDRVLLKLEDTSDKKSSGGIILNQSTQTVVEAVVIAVSDGYPSQGGEWIKLSVNEGDKVLISNGTPGEKIKLGGVSYNLVRDSDLLMKL
jgi:chaperonin GroES